MDNIEYWANAADIEQEEPIEPISWTRALCQMELFIDIQVGDVFEYQSDYIAYLKGTADNATFHNILQHKTFTAKLNPYCMHFVVGRISKSDIKRLLS